jgi:hypothetical protein
LIINGGDAPDWKAAFAAALLAELSLLNMEYAYDGIDFYLLDWNKVKLKGIASNNIMMSDRIHLQPRIMSELPLSPGLKFLNPPPCSFLVLV